MCIVCVCSQYMGAYTLYIFVLAVNASMPEQLQQYEQELKARADSLSAGEKVYSIDIWQVDQLHDSSHFIFGQPVLYLWQLPVPHIEVEDDITVDEVFDVRSDILVHDALDKSCVFPADES